MTSRTRYNSFIFSTTILGATLLGCNQTSLNVLDADLSRNQQVAASGQGSGLKGIERALQAQAQTNAGFLGRRGVVGTGIGTDDNGEPVIVVFVEDSSVIAKLPKKVAGVSLVVEVTGRIVTMAEGNGNGGKTNEKVSAQSGKLSNTGTNSTQDHIDPSGIGNCTVGDLSKRFERPVPIGVSAGIVGFSGGTYGARVRDAAGNLFMLSNNHTFAARNNAPLGTVGIQPRPQDGGLQSTDAIGVLTDFQKLDYCAFSTDGVQLEECRPNIMDAAILSTTAEMSGRATPCDGYGTPQTVPATPKNGMKIMKYGRTTGLTNGVITAVNVTMDVRFGQYANGSHMVARFTGQIIARPLVNDDIILGGDSGSLVVNTSGNPIGIVFAGGYNLAVINPIGPILERFGVSVDGL
jgi:hypothetical protein